MAKSKCELVRKGEAKHKGITADKIERDDGSVIYTCYGYKDAMTDQALPECERCELWERNHWWDW